MDASMLLMSIPQLRLACGSPKSSACASKRYVFAMVSVQRKAFKDTAQVAQSAARHTGSEPTQNTGQERRHPCRLRNLQRYILRRSRRSNPRNPHPCSARLPRRASSFFPASTPGGLGAQTRPPWKAGATKVSLRPLPSGHTTPPASPRAACPAWPPACLPRRRYPGRHLQSRV